MDADEDSGNFALLDIIKALQFVNRNIAYFGGNPARVTLMGQSAGAINVYALLTSPLVVNAHPRLFDRAVPLSGGISLATNLPPGRIPTLFPASVYLAQGNALLLNLVIAAAWPPTYVGPGLRGARRPRDCRLPALEEPATVHAVDCSHRWAAGLVRFPNRCCP
jgi:hypothetical protein